MNLPPSFPHGKTKAKETTLSIRRSCLSVIRNTSAIRPSDILPNGDIASAFAFDHVQSNYKRRKTVKIKKIKKSTSRPQDEKKKPVKTENKSRGKRKKTNTSHGRPKKKRKG
jgi:hypothetical protein